MVEVKGQVLAQRRDSELTQESFARVTVFYLQLTWCTPACVRKAVGERRRKDFTGLLAQKTPFV